MSDTSGANFALHPNQANRVGSAHGLEEPTGAAAARSDGFVEIGDLWVSFNTASKPYIAVRNVDLSIRRGEIFSIIGHSGCGKSTVLNTVGGLLKPWRGEVLLEGKPIAGPGPDRGIVFQHYSLLPWLNVYQNVFQVVDSVLRDSARPDKEDVVERVLTAVGLWESRDRWPHQISGGMKQRVAVARAFSIRPKVLLLDEPFGALDALTRASLREELLRLWSMDAQTESVLLVTHDIEEAIYLSDRIAVMTRGPAATVSEIIEVPIPRPRDCRAIAHLPEYLEVRDRLLYLLTSEQTSRGSSLQRDPLRDGAARELRPAS